MPEQRLISEADAAQYLGRSKTTFRQQVRAGKLPGPADQSTRRRLWDRRVLDQYVDSLSGTLDTSNPWDEL